MARARRLSPDEVAAFARKEWAQPRDEVFISPFTPVHVSHKSPSRLGALSARGLGMISAMFQAIFNRAILTLIYTTLSVIAAISIMIKGSFVVGLSVLVACAFSFFGTATFVGSFLARKEKALRMIDLIGIGSIAAILVVVSFMLAYWTGFRVIFEGWIIDGFYWLLIGMLMAFLVTRKEDAL
jgi:hypothetical protein